MPFRFVVLGSRSSLLALAALAVACEGTVAGPHAKLLVSICQAMGLDINGVGDRNPDSGPLTGILS